MIISSLTNFLQTDIGQSILSTAVHVADGALTGMITGVALGILVPICYYQISSMINRRRDGSSGILIVASAAIGAKAGAVAGAVVALGYDIYKKTC